MFTALVFIWLYAAAIVCLPSSPLPAQREAAIDIVVRNTENGLLSIKDLIALSRTNRHLRDTLRNDPLNRYLSVLQHVPCYSKFAENSYYVPSKGRRPSDTQSAPGIYTDRIQFKFSDWGFSSIVDGLWFDNRVVHHWSPVWETQETAITCIDQLLQANLNVEITALSPTNSDFAAYPSTLQNFYKHKRPGIQEAKQLLLWLAIKRNVTRVVDFLLKPNAEQHLVIHQRHVEAMADNKDISTLFKILNFVTNNSVSLDKSVDFWFPILSNFDPPQDMVDLMARVDPFDMLAFSYAARFGRKTTLQRLIANATNGGLSPQDLQATLLDAYYEALGLCHVGVLETLLEHGVELDSRSARTTFACAVQTRNFQRAAELFNQFDLSNQFLEWLEYLKLDEVPSPHVTRLLQNSYDYQFDDHTIKWIIEENLSQWPVEDLETFEAYDILGMDEESFELEFFDEQRFIIITAIRRNNLKRAKKYWRQFMLDGVELHLRDWFSALTLDELPIFLQITNMKVWALDIEQMIQSTYNVIETESMVLWLMKHLSYWSLDDLEYIEMLADQCGPSFQSKLKSVVHEQRKAARKRILGGLYT